MSPRRLVLLVNALDELHPEMATALLGLRAAQRGSFVVFVPVEAFSWSAHGAPLVRGKVAPGSGTPEEGLAELARSEEITLSLRQGDVLLLRTNPARDPQRAGVHRAVMVLARLAREAGVIVLNEPEGIERVGSKLYLLELPETVRPRQVVTADPEVVWRFAERESGPVVLKPLCGTRGQGVVKVDWRREGVDVLRRATNELLTGGHLVAQEYLPEAPEGDVRVILLEGRPLTVDGHVAAVRRRPTVPGEFRSNVHLGGVAERAEFVGGLRAVAEAVGPRLREAGIFLAGLDVVGSKIVEVNVFSPGGFASAEEFSGVDFLGAVLDAVAVRAASFVPAPTRS